MKMRSRSNDTCQLDMYMYTLQSFHTLNIVNLLLIVSEIWTWPPKLNLVHWSMKYGWGQVKTVWQGMRTLQGTHIPNVVILLLIIRENLTLQKTLTYFQVVTEPWKWGQGHWTCDWRKLRNMRHPYTKYKASRSSTF